MEEERVAKDGMAESPIMSRTDAPGLGIGTIREGSAWRIR
jgi:hypothetical protein